MQEIRIYQIARELTTHINVNSLLLLPTILPIINVSKYSFFFDLHLGFLFVGISFKWHFRIVHIVR